MLIAGELRVTCMASNLIRAVRDATPEMEFFRCGLGKNLSGRNGFDVRPGRHVPDGH
jgi:hypothetical protein